MSEKYEMVWLIYLKSGKKWIALRNSNVFSSKKKALASMAEDGLDQRYYQPIRINVPIVDLLIP